MHNNLKKSLATSDVGETLIKVVAYSSAPTGIVYGVEPAEAVAKSFTNFSSNSSKRSG